MNRKQRIIAELEKYKAPIPPHHAISIVERISNEPPTGEEIKRVAKAIWISDHSDQDTWEDGNPSEKKAYIEMAEAAIKAFMGESDA